MSKAAGTVKRYRETVVRKSLTALQDYFAPDMEESEHGKYVLATDYDALAAERDLAIAERDAANLMRTGLSTLLTAAQSSEERLKQVLREVQIELRGVGPESSREFHRIGIESALGMLKAALSTHPSAREQDGTTHNHGDKS